jgi:hypothetical protein
MLTISSLKTGFVDIGVRFYHIILISKDLDHLESEMDFVTKSCVLICVEEQTEVFEIHFFFARNVLS